MADLRKYDGACVLFALAYVSRADHGTVLRVCTQFGYSEKDGGGMYDHQWKKASKILNIKMRGVPMKPMELWRFSKKYPLGTFLLNTHDHLFTIDNGVIYDPVGGGKAGMRRKIISAWKVNGLGNTTKP